MTMSWWPYEFVTLSDEEKAHRSHAINHNASIAFWSAFAPAVLFLLCRLATRLYRSRGGQYHEVPNSPALKASRDTFAAGFSQRCRAASWWLKDDIYCFGSHWGHRDEWIVGIAWTAWLLFLCVRGTGKDHLHLTKRFGAIATSQLPIQYFLALKYLSPFGYLFHSSHEEINRWHRILGRIIYFLLLLHAILYNVFFVESGIWLKRFFAPVVFAGVVAFLCLHVLNGTSIEKLRNQSYRVFFVVHLVVAMAVPPLIFYHAHSARIYVSLAIGFLVLDLAARKITTINAPSIVESIHGTNLLKITSTMPSKKIIKFKAHPGAHLYLSLPPSSRPAPNDLFSKSNLLFEFLYNPFTVVSADEDSGNLTFIARKKSGPMTNRLAGFTAAGVLESNEGKISLCIEGPYGAIGKSFTELLSPHVGRIILVAGGVGATFAVPIYHGILADNPAAHVQFVWAIRSPGDATWVPANPAGQSLIDDDQVQLFLTGDMGVSQRRDATGDGVEMDDLSGRGSRPAEQNHKRPNLQKIIDDAFKSGADETVAVLVCGPTEMGRELRRCVTPWIMKGRNVWWHNESFGW